MLALFPLCIVKILKQSRSGVGNSTSKTKASFVIWEMEVGGGGSLEKQHVTVLWIFVCFFDGMPPLLIISQRLIVSFRRKVKIFPVTALPQLRPCYLPTPELVMGVAAAGGPGTPAMSDLLHTASSARMFFHSQRVQLPHLPRWLSAPLLGLSLFLHPSGLLTYCGFYLFHFLLTSPSRMQIPWR